MSALRPLSLCASSRQQHGTHGSYPGDEAFQALRLVESVPQLAGASAGVVPLLGGFAVRPLADGIKGAHQQRAATWPDLSGTDVEFFQANGFLPLELRAVNRDVAVPLQLALMHDRAEFPVSHAVAPASGRRWRRGSCAGVEVAACPQNPPE